MTVVFYSPDSYSLFFPDTSYVFGGAETRCWRFANGLAALPGYDVHVVTADQGATKQMAGQVHVWPHPEKKGQGYWKKRKTLGSRIAHRLGAVKQPQHTSLTELLDHIKPDVLVILGMSPDAWTLLEYAHAHNCQFVFGCASDLDLSKEYLVNRNGRDVTGNSSLHYSDVLAQADMILVQTPEQMKQLKDVFEREGELLLNPVNLGQNSSMAFQKAAEVLWVGKASKLKRPEIYVALARSLPHLKFHMVLNRADETIFEWCIKEKPSNLFIVESVPYSEIGLMFSRASVFVNTSVAEGFANTFLQAGLAGTPVVSMNADPNQMLSLHGGGVLCGNDENALRETVSRLMSSDSERAALGACALKYVRDFHDERKQVHLLSSLITTSLLKHRLSGT